eukprot:31071-Pelagococcus_subviridis.AAC.10
MSRMHRPQPETGEHVEVVPLVRDHRPPVDDDVVERRPRGENRASARRLRRLLRGALRARRRVRQRHDDRPLVALAHRPQDGLREDPARGGRAHEHGRLRRRDDVLQRHPLGEIIAARGERAKVFHPGRARLQDARARDQTFVIDDVEPLVRVLFGQAVVNHRGVKEIRDAHPGGPRAADHEGLVDDRARLRPDARHRAVHAREHGHRGALNVVVEAQDVVTVPLQDGHRVLRREIFKLHERVGPAILHRLHELVHELVVLLPPQSRLLYPEVIRRVQELFVVRADVEDAREHLLRVDPRAGDVEVELSDGDAHPLRAEVAQAQHSAAVRHDDHGHVVLPVVHHRVELPDVVHAEVHPSRTSEESRVVLARLAHGGGVDDGRELLDVLDDEAIEERLVAVLQRLHRAPHVHRRLPRRRHRVPDLRALLVDRELPRRREPADAEAFLLRDGVPRAFVVDRV